MSIRALANETAIYGLSSILGRGVYFLLTPIYTDFFTPFEMGIPTTVFAVIALLMVFSTLRLEVAYFSRHGKHPDERTLFCTAWLATALLGGLLGLGLLFGSPYLSELYGYPAYRWVFALGGGILFFDALVELPLARLRMESRPWMFAGVRLAGILLNVGLNVFWLLLLPKFPDAPAWLSASTAGVTYIFLANLISSGFVFLLLTPQLRGMGGNSAADSKPIDVPVSIGLRFDWSLLKELLSFSLPLVVVGFSFIINETIDRTLLPKVWPGGEEEGLTQAGIYGQCYKLAMLLALFTQAFRYGAEPYFFRESGHVDAPVRYARLARFYLLAALIGCALVSLFLPALSHLFLRSEEFRSGIAVVPILLAANLCLGLYYNLSVWYKVTDRTRWGAYISVGGAIITIVLNLLLIPILGFYGSAWATLACYASMMIAAWWFGRSRYPIPYALGRMSSYVLLTVGAVALYFWLSPKLGPSVFELAQEGATTAAWARNLALALVLFLTIAGVFFTSERRLLRAGAAT